MLVGVVTTMMVMMMTVLISLSLSRFNLLLKLEKTWKLFTYHQSKMEIETDAKQYQNNTKRPENKPKHYARASLSLIYTVIQRIKYSVKCVYGVILGGEMSKMSNLRRHLDVLGMLESLVAKGLLKF